MRGTAAASAIRPCRVAAVAVLLTAAAYTVCLNAPFFVVDDHQYITANAPLQAVPLSAWWRVFTTRITPWEYLPVRDLSVRIDLALFGRHPSAMRAHNVLLYGLCCLAIWPCLMAVQRAWQIPREPTQPRDTGGTWIALATLVLFAAHPAHVESVAWISGRKDLLSGLFAILSLWAFASALPGGRGGSYRLFGSFLLYALAALSKTTVVTLPGVALLLAAVAFSTVDPPWRSFRRAVLWTLPLFAIATAVTLVAALGTETSTLLEAAHTAPTRAHDVTTPFAILGTLARIAIAPLRLRLIYDLAGPDRPLVVGFGAVVAAATCISAWFAVRRRSRLCLGLSTFGILCMPFLQIVPFTTWSLASERFLFLPLLGTALAAACCIRPLPPRARNAVVILLFLAGLGLTFGRCRAWAARDVLLTRNAQLSPHEPTAVRMAIHHVLLKQQRFDAARQAVAGVRDPHEKAFLLGYVDAKWALAEGRTDVVQDLGRWLIEVAPREDFAVRSEIAGLLLEAGLAAEAEAAYRNILAEYPGLVQARYNMGLALYRLKRPAEAAVAMRAAIDDGLHTATAWNNLALAYRDAGRRDAAEAAFLRALTTDSRYWHAAYNLARLRIQSGDRNGALAALQTAHDRALANGDDTSPISALRQHLQ